MVHDGKPHLWDKAGTTLQDVTSKMKHAVLLEEGLEIRPHFRKLLLDIIAHQCYKLGKLVTLVKGTKVKEVSEPSSLQNKSFYWTVPCIRSLLPCGWWVS